MRRCGGIRELLRSPTDLCALTSSRRAVDLVVEIWEREIVKLLADDEKGVFRRPRRCCDGSNGSPDPRVTVSRRARRDRRLAGLKGRNPAHDGRDALFARSVGVEIGDRIAGAIGDHARGTQRDLEICATRSPFAQ